MPSVNVTANGDGFLNNISGYYSAEGYNYVSSTSSSDSDYNVAYTKFNSASAGIPANAIITAATFYWHVTAFSDINSVGGWTFYTDINNIWSNPSWGNHAQPDVPFGPAYGTVNEGSYGGIPAVGWCSKSISTLIPKSGIFGTAIVATLSDVGPASMTFDDGDSGGANKPYVAITYTVPPKGGTLTMMGVG